MENYIIIRELPDASVGTEVIWDGLKNYFYYKKSAFVSPNATTFLTAGQVTQNPLFFCKATEYPEHYAYKYPVYSREEILSLVKECFPNRRLNGFCGGVYEVSAAKEVRLFELKLREIGKINAQKLIKKQAH
jgi:hypothetical protein